MKRTVSLLLAFFLLLVSSPARAADRVMGWVLYTDIVAYIDGHPIRSYNINWNTYVIVEELSDYGFRVEWIPEAGRLVVHPDRRAGDAGYTAAYVPVPNMRVAGEAAMPYYYTKITTWIGTEQVTGYNIGGYTCICMDDLAAFFAADYVWDPDAKALRLTTRGGALEPVRTDPASGAAAYTENGGRIDRDYAVSNGGAFSYRMTSETPVYMTLALTMKTDPGARCLVSMDVKTAGNAVKTNVALNGSYGKETETTGTTDWHVVSQTCEADENGTIRLHVLFGYSEDRAAGTVWIDNISVVKEHVWDGGTVLGTDGTFTTVRYRCADCGELRLLRIPACGDGTRFVTSYSTLNGLEFSISGTALTVSGRIVREGMDKVWLACGDVYEIREVGNGEYFSITLPLDAVTEETNVTLFTHVAGGENFQGLIWRTVRLYPEEGGYRFVSSPVLEHNVSVSSRYSDPEIMLRLNVSDEVRDLSDRIVGGETDTRQKILALYRWVTENVYYDYDYFSGRSKSLAMYPEEVLSARRTVCSGYANLLTALLQAQGIPASSAQCFALGISQDGFDSAAAERANHAYVQAYLASENRWLLLDPTWDSGNAYEYGTYRTAPAKLLYFDVSWDYMALEHKIFPLP